MTTPTRSHYHYHSFPRRWRDKSECDNKGVATLASIIESGLLLTPEQVHWPGEFKKGVRVSEGPISYHRRACFTYLLPDELNDHAKEFGPFSIEFDHWELRILGGIPVIYLPTESEYRGFLGVGIALASRLTDFQTLLERLQLLLEMCEGVDAKSVDFICTPAPDGGILVGPNKAGAKMMHFRKELLQAIKAEKPAFEIPKLNGPTPFGGSTGCILSLLRMLTWGIESYNIQLGSLQALGGYFYPSERLGSGDLLSYYRQREWRILGSMELEGVAATRPQSSTERARLLALDEEFFTRPITLRDGTTPQTVDECVLLSEVDGKHVLRYARRIICPRSAKPRVEMLLRNTGFDFLAVSDIESVHERS